jgi:biotin transport system substrate-specific component
VLKTEWLLWLSAHLKNERNLIIIMEKQCNPSIRNTKTYTLVVTALMAAVTCILAPLSIPIGPVPVSLTNFVIYLSLYLLDWKKRTISYLVYLLIGLAGVPVFSGFTGGVAKLAGPTGGYIIGFIPMAVIAGIAIDKFQQRWIHLIGMITGTVVCYAFGTLWFCLQSGTAVAAALSICVFPFIPGDLVKMIIAIFLAKKIREKLDMVHSS